MKVKVHYNDSKFSKIVLGFKLYYIVYLVLAFNAFVNASVILDVLTYITALVGSSLAICQILIYKETLKTRFFWIQIAFLISYALSSAVNISYGYIDNAKTIIWTVLPLILLYSNAFLLNENNQKKEIKYISITYISLIAINNIVSISMLFWGYMYDFIDQTGTARAIGFRWDRLWGVYDDPNHGATISVVAVLLAIYLYKFVDKKLFKALLVLSIVIQTLYIIFSDSRTGFIALIVGITIWGLFNFKSKRFAKVKVFPLVATFIMVASIVVSDTAIKNLYEMNFFVETVKVTRTETSHDSDTRKTESARKNDVESNATSGRTAIWSSGIDIFSTTPIVGTSFRNLTEYALKNMPETYIVKTEWMRYDSMHNMPLDVLVSQGVVGAIIFIAFGVMVMIYLIKRKAWQYFKKSQLFTCMASIVIALFISSMFMSIIYFVHCPQTYMFWLSFGMCVSIIEREHKRKALSD